MLKKVVKNSFLLGISFSCGLACAVEEQLAEAPSLDAEVTDRIEVDAAEYKDTEGSLLSNSPRSQEAMVSQSDASADGGTSFENSEKTQADTGTVSEEIRKNTEAVSASVSEAEKSAADIEEKAHQKDDVSVSVEKTDENPEAGKNTAEVSSPEKNSDKKASAEGVIQPENGAENSVKSEIPQVPAEKENSRDSAAEAAAVSAVKTGRDSAEAKSEPSSVSGSESNDKKAETGAVSQAPEKTGDSGGKKASQPQTENNGTEEVQSPQTQNDAAGSENSAESHPIYDILKKRQQSSFVNPNLYSRDYLSEMYLPYFYNTYELPQDLSPYITLRTVRLDKKGAVLVYDIGTADALGPMDFDGTPEDNKTLNLFCRIALNEGILHRLDKIVLVFYHDDRDYSEVSLDYLKCTGKEPLLVEKSVLSHESVRLDDEFIYAYESEPEGPLSADYLKKRFAPFALKRIGEKFDRIENNPIMTATDDSSLVVLLSVNPKDAAKVKQADFVAGRIDRTCSIDTYGKWILPRIHELRYVYHESGSEKVIKEIVVTDKACRAVRSQLKR